jgi:hypothetical protein
MGTTCFQVSCTIRAWSGVIVVLLAGRCVG